MGSRGRAITHHVRRGRRVVVNYTERAYRQRSTVTRLTILHSIILVSFTRTRPNKMSLFDGVTFFCASTLSDKRKAELTLLLEHNGARPVLLGEATHIITLSLDYEGQDGAKEGSFTVTARLL
jgi:hypothetical protein